MLGNGYNIKIIPTINVIPACRESFLKKDAGMSKNDSEQVGMTGVAGMHVNNLFIQHFILSLFL